MSHLTHSIASGTGLTPLNPIPEKGGLAGLRTGPNPSSSPAPRHHNAFTRVHMKDGGGGKGGRWRAMTRKK